MGRARASLNFSKSRFHPVCLYLYKSHITHMLKIQNVSYHSYAKGSHCLVQKYDELNTSFLELYTQFPANRPYKTNIPKVFIIFLQDVLKIIFWTTIYKQHFQLTSNKILRKIRIQQIKFKNQYKRT